MPRASDAEMEAAVVAEALLAPELRATVALQELWNLACPFVSPPPLWPMVRHAAVVEPFPRIFTREGIATAAQYLDHASARYRVRANLFLMEALRHSDLARAVTSYYEDYLSCELTISTAVECGVVGALALHLHCATHGAELEHITRCLKTVFEHEPSALWTIEELEFFVLALEEFASLSLDRFWYDFTSNRLLLVVRRIIEARLRSEGDVEFQQRLSWYAETRSR